MQNSVAAVPLHVYGQCAERFRRQRASEAAHDDLSGVGAHGQRYGSTGARCGCSAMTVCACDARKA